MRARIPQVMPAVQASVIFSVNARDLPSASADLSVVSRQINLRIYMNEPTCSIEAEAKLD